jgi:Short C-terminal domain
MNNNNNKVITLVVGAVVGLFALSLLLRFVLLSSYGVPGGWIYLGLPVGGIGVLLLLLRLGLLNFGERSGGTIHHWHQNTGVQAPPPASPPPAASVSQRLQELDTLHASGAISDTEYTAKRQRIIANVNHLRGWTADEY